MRRRVCIKTSDVARDCLGYPTEHVFCHKDLCKGNCAWSLWSQQNTVDTWLLKNIFIPFDQVLSKLSHLVLVISKASMISWHLQLIQFHLLSVSKVVFICECLDSKGHRNDGLRKRLKDLASLTRTIELQPKGLQDLLSFSWWFYSSASSFWIWKSTRTMLSWWWRMYATNRKEDGPEKVENKALPQMPEELLFTWSFFVCVPVPFHNYTDGSAL